MHYSDVYFLLMLFAPGVLHSPGDGQPAAKPLPQETSTGLAPRTMTLRGNDIPLSKALEELARQTGNRVEDRRQVKDGVKIKLDLDKATFWQALDAVARAADARVTLFDRDALVALADGPYQMVPVSYHGLFRVMVKRIDLTRSFETDQHVCNIHLEVAWEPRFQPLMMESRSEALVVRDDKGRAAEVPEAGQGMMPIGRRLAKDIQLQVAAPHRSASQLGMLKGTLKVVGPDKMLTFKFDKLDKIEKRAEARTQSKDGVSVSLRELRAEGEGGDAIWTVGVLLEYPADGPKFESFQSWLVHNEIYLEKSRDGAGQKFAPNLGYETDDSTDAKAILRYRFGDEPAKKLVLGKFGDWNLIYRTPGRITTMDVPFEFKDVPLP
jgi:hypothetical protein